MKVLGIMWEENATAALVVDGEVVASVSEERFSRRKNDESYPKRAIEYVLHEGGISPQELDAVAFMGTMWGPAYTLVHRYSTYSIMDNIREQNEYWRPVLVERKKTDYLRVFKDKLDTKQYPGPAAWGEAIAFLRKHKGNGRAHDERMKTYFQGFRKEAVCKHLGISPGKVHFVDHSTGHAMYAYFASPAKGDALVLTADAWGDHVNASVNHAKKGVIQRIASSGDFVVARLYRSITLVLGMKPNEHEFKVMGLAPYSKKKYSEPVRKIFERIQKVKGLGFEFVAKPRDLYFTFRELLEGYRFDSIAGGLQAYTEEMLISWAKNALKKTHANVICFAGGVAMNVKANMLLQALPGVSALYVNASPDDASQAMAACFALEYEHARKHKRDPRAAIKPLRDAYLGPAIESERIGAFIAAEQIERSYTVTRNASPARVAELLVAGRVIARAAGRSEFGARALGNRSIIADPRNQQIIAVINEKIKSRDFWMPFATSILERRAADYLIDYKGWAPYMTLAFETTKLAHTHLSAGLHPSDHTCRPQVIPEGHNSGYEAIIHAFEAKTGVGGVLNTSFNLHGEPIVQTIEDAWRVFKLSDLDALLLEDTLIEKR